ncbi:MAG: M28 family peptidase [Planctomycetota bacterium]
MFDRLQSMVQIAALFTPLTMTVLPCGADGGPHDRFMSRARQLTFEGRRAGEGYFSPDGKKMVLMSEHYPENPFFQIYTFDLETGDARLISPGVGRTTCPFFRPGADEVLFASTHLDPQAKEKQRKEYEDRENPNARRMRWDYDESYDLFVTDTRGPDLRRLTETLGYDAECSYSPDGRLIVFASNRDAFPLEKLTPEQREQYDKQPAYFNEIYILNADGTNPRRLTDSPGEDGGPFFTPDGQRIIWRHFDESGMLADVYTLKIDGSDRRRLTDFACMSWCPYMHPSGEYAIFSASKQGFANFELYIVDALGEKEPVRVTYTDGFDALPVFAPDGKSVSWTSARHTPGRGRAQIFLADWDHPAALAAIRNAPPRGTPEPDPDFGSSANSGWPMSGPPQEAKPGLEPAITRNDLYAQVKYLASDELEGRMTGTEGTRLAAEYIAARFKEAGLEPLGDNGTYFQEFPFPAGLEMVKDKNQLRSMGPLEVKASKYRLDQEFRPLSFTANDHVTSLMVFAGYGLVVPAEQGQPAYDSYAGLEVQGKFVLVLDDVPQKLPTEQRIRFSLYSSPRYKALQAKQRGAKGFLLVVGPATPGAGELLPLSRTSSDVGIVAASITPAVADRLLDEASVTIGKLQTMLDGGEIPPACRVVAPKLTWVELLTELKHKEGRCRNVLGLLPAAGAGPVTDEYVLVGAHYDHIGHGEGDGSRAHAGEEGQIHNGADDNASGDATALELAAALADARKRGQNNGPQRGIIFACWSGEELGVIGSTHFARHAPCPLERITAYVNFDMVGRLRDGRLVLQAVGSSPDWPRLLEKVNIVTPLNLVLQDDPYLPSDTHEFYPAGVPVLSFFTDIHDDYNRPTDDADTLNYAGMEQIGRFAGRLLVELARNPQRPSHAEVKRATPGDLGGGGRRRIYTGTIPDFVGSDIPGMKISGVQGGSPAEKAGLKPGDVIVKIAGQEIKSLEDYSVVLGALKPDESVEIVVSRDQEEVRLQITPTVRQ